MPYHDSKTTIASTMTKFILLAQITQQGLHGGIIIVLSLIRHFSYFYSSIFTEALEWNDQGLCLEYAFSNSNIVSTSDRTSISNKCLFYYQLRFMSSIILRVLIWLSTKAQEHQYAMIFSSPKLFDRDKMILKFYLHSSNSIPSIYLSTCLSSFGYCCFCYWI